MASQRRDDLDQVLIGSREKRSIVIADYDTAWPRRFARERERIDRALGETALLIEHIGFTAVPGLAAKPIVDVLVAVENPDDDTVIRPALEAAGHELRVREPGHRMFRTPARDVQVHILSGSDPEFERHLRFRDRLRASPEDRQAYERLKRSLASRQWEDTEEYAEAKTDLIRMILSSAREEGRAGGRRDRADPA